MRYENQAPKDPTPLTREAQAINTGGTQVPIVVTAPEAAKILAISERHFRGLVYDGLAPQPTRLGRRTVWLVSAIQDWLEAGAPRVAQGGVER